MRIRSMFLFSCLAMLYFAATLWAQQNQVSSTASTAAASPVPRLIKFSGTLLGNLITTCQKENPLARVLVI